MTAFILPTVKQKLANNTSEKHPKYDTAFILPTVKQRLASNTSEKQPTYDKFHTTNCETKIGKQHK